MAKKKKHRETTAPTRESAESIVEPLDYKKLAQCIAKAIAEENDKRMNAYSVTREWMKYIAWPIFGFIIILMVAFSIWGFIMTVTSFSAVYSSPTFSVTDIITTLLKGIASFAVTLLCSGIATFAFFACKEFEEETDRQFVVSVFSSMVSLVALIVALAALFMGVK